MRHPLSLRSVPLTVLAGGVAWMAVASPCASAQVKWTQEELDRISLEIQRDIEVLRGKSFKGVVPAKLATKPEFLEYAIERQERTEPPAKVAADEQIAKMLGLIPPDMDLVATGMKLLEEQVGGVYLPERKVFYLMENVPPGVAKPTLAHELTHALDDQIHDLDAAMELRAMETDALLAYQAVVEGSGMSVMARWMQGHADEVDMAGMSEFEEESNRSLAKAPMYLWKPLMGAYLVGMEFLSRTDSLMGSQLKPAKNEDLDRALLDPPRSTEQVLHPEKYWDPVHLDPPRRIEHAADTLPEGWKVLRRDTLGELILGLLTTPLEQRAAPDFSNAMSILGLKFTSEISSGWGGDALVLLGKGDARVLQLVTVWDSERDAGEFFGALNMLQPQLASSVAALAKDEKHESSVALAYGGEPNEVVLDLACGVGRSELRKVLRALTHREVAGQEK
jgi:hypothetical protein